MEEKKGTTTEEADKYIEEIKEEIRDCSAHEKNGILLEKVRYWFWSAIDWRNTSERETAKASKILEEGMKKYE